MGIVTYSTDDVRTPASRGDWITMVHRHLDALEVELGESETFHGSFSSATVGENRVSFVTADVQNIQRAPRHRDRNAPLYHMIYVREGQFDLHSVTYKGLLKAGQWVTLTNQEAFRFETSTACSCVVLHLANRWLRNFLPDPESIIEKQHLDYNAWHESLRYCLQAISEMPIQTMEGEGKLALEQVPRLLALAYNLHTGEWSKHQSAMMRAIMAEIRAHHSTPGLTAEAAAENLGISRRYLYAITEKHGTSFLRELQKARLDRAAEMLSSRQFASTSVADIAVSVGLLDTAHFSRLFKARFAMTPSEFRLNKSSPN